MSKILLIGDKGMLGSDLKYVLAKKNKIIGMSRPQINIVDINLCRRVCQKYKPDVVINTAAYHKIQDCHTNPDLALSVNAHGAFNIALAAKEVGAKVVFISTDYVFDGLKDSFTEFDNPNPLNVYGASKLAGEFLTLIGNPSSYIIRTSWLFGIHQEHSSKGPNFVTQILSQALEGKEIQVVSDQFGSPTYTADLAKKINEMLEKKFAYGVYHISNSQVCSWHEYALEILKLSGYTAQVKAVLSDSFVSDIIRPKRSVLSSRKLKPMRSWQKALAGYIKFNKLKRQSSRSPKISNENK